MKPFIILLMLLAAQLVTSAQSIDSTVSKPKAIPSYNLSITWNKTTLLVFPAAVESADRGNELILAEKVKGVDNILKVKAAFPDFEESNLQVITADGKVYPFTVRYDSIPETLTMDLRPHPAFPMVSFSSSAMNSEQLKSYSNRIAGSKPFLKVKDCKFGIRFITDGVFVKDEVIFIRFRVLNESSIPYQVESLRFYVRDKKKAKRTAQQDREIQPIFLDCAGAPENDLGQTIVAAFSRFTIADNKNFTIELMEKNGDRNLSVSLDHKKMLKARILN